MTTSKLLTVPYLVCSVLPLEHTSTEQIKCQDADWNHLTEVHIYCSMKKIISFLFVKIKLQSPLILEKGFPCIRSNLAYVHSGINELHANTIWRRCISQKKVSRKDMAKLPNQFPPFWVWESLHPTYSVHGCSRTFCTSHTLLDARDKFYGVWINEATAMCFRIHVLL